MNIRAQSHEIEEFKANYGSIDLFYHEKKSGYSTTPSEVMIILIIVEIFTIMATTITCEGHHDVTFIRCIQR